MKEVRILADSTCDLGRALTDKYNVDIIPLNIIMDDASYTDGEEINPDDIFRWADERKTTPKTAAVGMDRAEELLLKYPADKYDIIFFGISEEMSTTCNVVRLTADNLGLSNVHVIDSMNLSAGTGLLVLKACRMAEEGMDAETIVRSIEGLRDRVRASFVVDTLTYLSRGGRCKAITALLANRLHLHPMIEVEGGVMKVSRKYRGKIEKALLEYAEDMREKLLHADRTRVFITHSGCRDNVIEEIRSFVESLGYFEEVLITRAGGVISSHCGPGTLGILYIEE